FITGISGRKHFTIITLHKVGMSGEVGLIRKALEAVERFGVPIEHVPSGVDSFSLVIASDALENCLHDMISELQTVCQPDTVKVTEDISLIAVVGRKMAFKPGVSGRLFATLGSNNINIRLIEQSADEIIIVVGVKDEDFEKTIKVLYYSFT
ncbi:MAG: ACT domain-containing protein, partial [Eubacteriales bacterium]|nr:ACT domain-containing protein [Eubacteriales bacterium]